MRQFQFTVHDEADLRKKLNRIRSWCESREAASILFQLHSSELDRDRFETIFRIIDEEIPGAQFIGCSSNGNIVNGDFSDKAVGLYCTVFDDPDTRIRILQYPITEDTQESVAKTLIQEVKSLGWVKGIEMLLTIRGLSLSTLCDTLSELPEEIQLFGGGAFSVDINNDIACVFSSEGGYMEQGIVFALYGGSQLHIETTRITGWKPLGMVLEVTDSDGCILKELNHLPAYEIYYKYLHIQNDENFFSNTLEFPFLFEHNGIELLRAPTKSNPDGSLTMTSDINTNVKARICYGDPWTILSSIRKDAESISRFAPQMILVFSCAARRSFWGNDEIGKETLPLQQIAPTFGFYTSGEFLRTGKYVNQHNVTLVIASMREGPAREMPPALDDPEEIFAGKVSMINRLATFIKATTEELIEANRLLERMAITDGLTGLYNRKEIQRRITEAIEEKKLSGTYLIMMDIDDFKKVNDTYGHDEGDRVLVSLSNLLLSLSEKEGIRFGRWGGEEFMGLISGVTLPDAERIAELIRSGFASIVFPEAGHKTISVGVTPALRGEKADDTCTRVDSALYKAKALGKNRTVTFNGAE